jgi:3-deoxy-D-manno-octulosonic-acid transferase
VIFGPYTGNVRDAVEALCKTGAAFEVKSVAELRDTMVYLAADPMLCSSSGELAYRVWQQNIGATLRVVGKLLELFGAAEGIAEIEQGSLLRK